MRILLLTKDFADESPRGEHVRRLAEGLAADGHDVRVVTREGSGSVAGDLDVHPVPEYAPLVSKDDEVAWALQFNLGALERAMNLLMRVGVDVVHAHEWATGHAAAMIRRRFEVPLVATLSSTRYAQRRRRLRTDDDRIVHQVEWWLAAEARRLIVPSYRSRERTAALFSVPARRIAVVPDRASLGAAERSRALARATLRVYEEAVAADSSPRRSHRRDAPSLRTQFEASPLLGAGR